jgi:hypothetical protein
MPERNFMQGFPGPVSGNLEYDFPIALYNPNNEALVASVALALSFSFAAYPRFVHFDNATQKHLGFSVPSLIHSRPDSMAEIPSCLVGDIKRAFKLVSGNTFLGFNHHVDSEEPLLQW